MAAKAHSTTCDEGPDPLSMHSVPAGASRAHVLTLRLKRALDANITHILKKHSDLSVPQWRILSVLSRCEGVMTQKEVVSKIAIAQGQASRALFSLQSNGIVLASQSKEDRRSWNYCLSPKGRALFDSLLPHMERRRTALDGAVTADELRQLERIATKIARAADARQENT